MTMLRTNQLPVVERQCPECGLNVRTSAGEQTWPIAASLCKHGSWYKCPKLNFTKARRSAQRRANALRRAQRGRLVRPRGAGSGQAVAPTITVTVPTQLSRRGSSAAAPRGWCEGGFIGHRVPPARSVGHPDPKPFLAKRLGQPHSLASRILFRPERSCYAIHVDSADKVAHSRVLAIASPLMTVLTRPFCQCSSAAAPAAGGLRPRGCRWQAR